MKKYKLFIILFVLCLGAFSSIAWAGGDKSGLGRQSNVVFSPKFVGQANQDANCNMPGVDCVFDKVLDIVAAEYGVTTLPDLSPPLANYVNAVEVDDVVFVSSAGPEILTTGGGFIRGELPTLTMEQAQEAAMLSCIRGLRFLKSVIGDLDKVEKVVMVTGNVNIAPDYDDILSGPAVGAIGKTVDGCSDFLVEVFGEDIGKHARAVGGKVALPFNIATEIEIIVEIH
ncbi:MAG: RidA family protein [Chloroflexi bacterium]|nr:RidA family protein [Chloroflexota bacterium]MCI0649105.1 RidA family protein [Chloroflexota bacterium]MCI0726993.1 RidA family protein [Chloroflexota bacterium]